MSSQQGNGSRSLEQGVLVYNYESHQIRCGGGIDNPWFVAKDVAEVLGITWKGNETLASIPEAWRGVRKFRTPRRNPDGSIGFQFQDVVVINESALYKLAFRSNKPQADAFTNWVAGEVLPSIRKTGVYRHAKRQEYLQRGFDPKWIERREQGVVVRKELTDMLHERGIEEGWQYGACTNAIYRPTLKGDAAQIRQRLGIGSNGSIRDNLPVKEVLKVALAEQLAAEKIEAEDSQGYLQCHRACSIAGNAVAKVEQQVLLDPPKPN